MKKLNELVEDLKNHIRLKIQRNFFENTIRLIH